MSASAAGAAYLCVARLPDEPGEVERRLVDEEFDEGRRHDDDERRRVGQLADARPRARRQPPDQLPGRHRHEPEAEVVAAEVVEHVARPLAGVVGVHQTEVVAGARRHAACCCSWLRDALSATHGNRGRQTPPPTVPLRDRWRVSSSTTCPLHAVTASSHRPTPTQLGRRNRVVSGGVNWLLGVGLRP